MIICRACGEFVFKLLRALEAATGLTSPGMARINVLVVVMLDVVDEEVPICIMFNK